MSQCLHFLQVELAHALQVISLYYQLTCKSFQMPQKPRVSARTVTCCRRKAEHAIVYTHEDPVLLASSWSMQLLVCQFLVDREDCISLKKRPATRLALEDLALQVKLYCLKMLYDLLLMGSLIEECVAVQVKQMILIKTSAI